MKKKDRLPILVIIPHGGYTVPEELENYTNLKEFDIFLNADTCANELFSFTDKITAGIGTSLSRLFMDFDRELKQVAPLTKDGIIKIKTSDGKKIYRDNSYPDEVAVSNLLKRYYYPFHRKIETLLKEKEINLILECHTMSAVGSPGDTDADQPRPLISLYNQVTDGDHELSTCTDTMISSFKEILLSEFSHEEEPVCGKVEINNPMYNGFIFNRFGKSDIPMIRMSVSKSLFINDVYFNYDYLSVDSHRLEELNGLFWNSIERFYNENF